VAEQRGGRTVVVAVESLPVSRRNMIGRIFSSEQDDVDRVWEKRGGPHRTKRHVTKPSHGLGEVVCKPLLAHVRCNPLTTTRQEARHHDVTRSEAPRYERTGLEKRVTWLHEKIEKSGSGGFLFRYRRLERTERIVICCEKKMLHFPNAVIRSGL
jgi:hypothetical protein